MRKNKGESEKVGKRESENITCRFPGSAGILPALLSTVTTNVTNHSCYSLIRVIRVIRDFPSFLCNSVFRFYNFLSGLR